MRDLYLSRTMALNRHAPIYAVWEAPHPALDPSTSASGEDSKSLCLGTACHADPMASDSIRSSEPPPRHENDAVFRFCQLNHRRGSVNTPLKAFVLETHGAYRHEVMLQFACSQAGFEAASRRKDSTPFVERTPQTQEGCDRQVSVNESLSEIERLCVWFRPC